MGKESSTGTLKDAAERVVAARWSDKDALWIAGCAAGLAIILLDDPFGSGWGYVVIAAAFGAAYRISKVVLYRVRVRVSLSLVAFCGATVFAPLSAAGTKDIMPAPTERQQQAIDVLAKLDAATAPTREAFVAGATSFALYHEFGHFLIDEYDIPILGRGQEDMADAYATFALAPYTASEQMQSAVRLWLYLAFDRGTAPIAWWDEHSLDHQRAFDVACVLTGRWPQRYAGLPEAFGASAKRAALCALEAPRRQTAWVETLRTHNAVMIDRQVAVVTYLPAPAELADIERWLRASGLLEAVATEIQRYELPAWRVQWRAKLNEDMAEGRLSANAFERTKQKVDVTAKSCGMANAYYAPPTDKPAVPGILPKGTMPHRPRLVLCYELIEKFRTLAAEAGLAE
jgi:hypothetical protein